MMFDLSRPQVGIELNTNMLDEWRFQPLLDAGATFALVHETREGKSIHTDDAGTYSARLARQIPTYLWGPPEAWSYSLTRNHAGMILPEWPYWDAAYFLENLNNPGPHVQQAVDDESKSLADMRRDVSDSMIGRYVSSIESISELERLETDFLILGRNYGQSYSALEAGLMASMIAVAELPTLVQGTESGESASSAMESGARGVIISAQSLSVELVAEVVSSLSE
jgi:hypothetical protein